MQIHKDEIPENYCVLCSKQYTSSYSLRAHMKSTHPIFNNSKPRKSPHPGTSPASNHTNSYCSVCNRKFANKWRHMKVVHNITPEPRKSKIRYPDRTLDTNDPNNYCNVCDFKFKTTYSYHAHLMIVHFVYVSSTNSSLPSNLSSEKPIIASETLHCNVCCITFNRNTTYRLHLRNVHGLSKIHNGGFIAGPRNVPDINDENNHCRVCRYKFATKLAYRKHLMTVHWIQLSQSENSKPDINDPNNYCLVCDKKYLQKSIYTTHLFRNHPEVHQQLKKKAEPKYHAPVIDFKNNFCNVCQRAYKSNLVYKLHLKFSHNIFITTFRNSDINPVANDPNNYCRSCERIYSSKSTYRTHLINIHKISPKELVYARRSAKPNIIAPITENSINNCNTCDKSYKTRSTYLCHMFATHNIKFPKRRLGKPVGKSIEDIKDDGDYEVNKKVVNQ